MADLTPEKRKEYIEAVKRILKKYNGRVELGTYRGINLCFYDKSLVSKEEDLLEIFEAIWGAPGQKLTMQV